MIARAAHAGLGVAAARGRRWPGNSSASLSRGLAHSEGMRSSEIFLAQVGLAVRWDTRGDRCASLGSTHELLVDGKQGLLGDRYVVFWISSSFQFRLGRRRPWVTCRSGKEFAETGLSV